MIDILIMLGAVAAPLLGVRYLVLREERRAQLRRRLGKPLRW